MNLSFSENFHLDDLWVLCLCARWCGVCQAYQEGFWQIRHHFPMVRFVWVDVEDQADLLDGMDVDDFPTVLIARGEKVCFFGALTPHMQTLERLIQNYQQVPDLAFLPSLELSQLIRRVQASGNNLPEPDIL